MAQDMEVPFLGKLPLDPRIGRYCDEGKSFLTEVPDSPAADAYKKIIKSKLLSRTEGLCFKFKIVLNTTLACEDRRISGRLFSPPQK